MSELLTISAFARAAGCDEKQVRRAVAKGLLRKDSEGFLDAAQIGTRWRNQNRRTRGKVSETTSDKGHMSEEMSEGLSDTSGAARCCPMDAGWLTGAPDIGLDAPLMAAEAAMDAGVSLPVAKAIFNQVRDSVRARLDEIAAKDEIVPEPEVGEISDYWTAEKFPEPTWDTPRPWPRGTTSAYN